MAIFNSYVSSPEGISLPGQRPTCQGELLAAGHRQRPAGRHLPQGAHDAAHARGAIRLHVGKGVASAPGTSGREGSSR